MHPLGRLLLACTAALVLSGCTSQPALSERNAASSELAEGREQLVDAFNAAWVRVLASGRARAITAQHPAVSPGAALSYKVGLADCLPNPEYFPFPEQPVGLLREIIERGTIRGVTQDASRTPDDTSYYFSPISQALLQAILDELRQHYAAPFVLEDVLLGPGDNATTTPLVDGRADFVGLLNATGGQTQGMARRASRRWTCTISAASQFFHVPEDAPLAASLNTMDDVLDRPGLRICTGPLSTQTIRAFMPAHQVTTYYARDLARCVADVREGKADVIASPLPYLEVAGHPGFKYIHTLLAAGTPLWVARENISCPDNGDPARENRCFEIPPAP